MECTTFTAGVLLNMLVCDIWVCFADFSYEYVQREALRVPLIFKEKDGLGIRSDVLEKHL